MLKKSIYILSLVLISASFYRCAEPEASAASNAEKFTRIFDTKSFDASFVPLDIKQTSDGGYIILSAQLRDTSDYSCIHLLKADKTGNFVKDLSVGQSLFNALPELTLINNRYYFICMNGNAISTIASVDPELNSVETVVIEGLTYPAASAFDNGGFLLLSYDSENLMSVISRVSVTGNITGSKGYSIGVDEDVEEPVLEHFLFNGKKFPFSVGRVNGSTFYFNGFFDYTFSLVFTDMNSDAPTGVVAGQHENGGFSALSLISGSTFATARFHFGDNFLLPRANLQVQGNSTGSDIKDYSLPELTPNAKIRILRAVINGQNVIIYGSDTRSKQIGLYFYSESAGTFISSRYLGFSNPYEFASAVPTTDGGLAVCGTTYLAGRFPRICIFKLSADDVKSNVP